MSDEERRGSQEASVTGNVGRDVNVAGDDIIDDRDTITTIDDRDNITIQMPDIKLGGVLGALALIVILAIVLGLDLPDLLRPGGPNEGTPATPGEQVSSPASESDTGVGEDEDDSDVIVPPDTVIVNYWAAVAEGDYQTAWAYLSPKFQQDNHAEGFDAYRQGHEAALYCNLPVSGVQLVSDDGSLARVDAMVRYIRGQGCAIDVTVDFRFTLVYDTEVGWLLDESEVR